MTMNQMKIGDAAIVTRLDVRGRMRRRLRDLGLIEGTYIECLQKSPFGDPSAYLIRGAVIAIRADETSLIYVATSENLRHPIVTQLYPSF